MGFQTPILLIATATLLALGATLVTADQATIPKDQSPSLDQPSNDILHSKGNWFLRVQEGSTRDEERAVNLIDLFDNKWFGVAKVAVRNENIANYEAVTKKFGDFSPYHLLIMNKDRVFKDFLFKKWDAVTMEKIKQTLGERIHEKFVAKIVVDYVQNHRTYGKFKTS
ncbi:RxLR effector protein [Phytophthora megakarya]|uniref:RxLR effector protein n=1 Tax=Phytophthora megakarya TaxID=4795 RepID=A0A225V7Q8_9STRA|nr:RxLR effector protein [Phytophthora megakarya]